MKGDIRNYYQLLGLSWNASPEEVRAAYRIYAAKFHPDKHEGDPFFEERFKEVQEAYQILSDPEKRRTYDLRTLGRRRVERSGAQTADDRAKKIRRRLFEVRRLDIYLAAFYWINLYAWSIIQRMNDHAAPGGYAWGLFLSMLSAYLIWYFISGAIARINRLPSSSTPVWIGSAVAGLSFAYVIVWTTWLP